MADKMGFSIKPSAKFLEALGMYKEAARELKGELKDLQKEAREAAKEGRALSQEKQTRIRDLESRHERARDAARVKDEISKTANETIDRRMQALFGSAGRLVRGGVGLSDAGVLGKYMRQQGAKLYENAAPGSLAQGAGLMLARAGAGLGKFAASAALPLALGTAGGFAISGAANAYARRQALMAEDTIGTEQGFFDLLSGDISGTRISSGFMDKLRAGVARAAGGSNYALTRGNALEGLLQWAGYGVSESTTRAMMRAEALEQKRQIMARRLGDSWAESMSMRNVREQYKNEIEHAIRLRRNHAGGWVSRIALFFYDAVTGDSVYESQAEEVARDLQDKAMETQALRMATRDPREVTNPRHVVWRSQEMQRVSRVAALIDDQHMRAMQWNPF